MWERWDWDFLFFWGTNDNRYFGTQNSIVAFHFSVLMKKALHKHHYSATRVIITWNGIINPKITTYLLFFVQNHNVSIILFCC